MGLCTTCAGFHPSRGSVGGGGGGGCSDSSTFLARGTFDGTHTTAYQDFICGLNTDGIGIFSGAFDVLVILGTQNTTVAALNLASTSFSASPQGSPSFTADRGYTGVDASATVYIDTQYNANTQATAFAQNSSHISVWCNTNVTAGASGGSAISAVSGTAGSRIFPKYNDGHAYTDINDSALNSISPTQTSSIGHFIANRSGASASQLYYNGSSVATASGSSFAAINTNFVVLASTNLGTKSFGYAGQISAYSIGRSLNSTEAGNFYSRMRTLGTALGWT